MVKKTTKDTPVVVEEEETEDEDEYDEEDDGDFDDEDDDESVVPIEDEIAVTDKEGNEELIEFPEAEHLSPLRCSFCPYTITHNLTAMHCKLKTPSLIYN